MIERSGIWMVDMSKIRRSGALSGSLRLLEEDGNKCVRGFSANEVI